MNDLEVDRFHGDWYLAYIDKDALNRYIPKCMKMVESKGFEDLVQGDESDTEFLKRQQDEDK